ncbi:MAG: Gfo/Idh/MocA family oxidoreductase [Gloeobacteraceae cyanobacterium ES-bin-144]|nr:Gfo/Idh/MocA family oxidoreductase [Verrucomicrobiales bacterium]
MTMERRTFIKTAIGASIAAEYSFANPVSTPDRKLGWALVGLGSLSTHQLAPALQKTTHSKLSAIVTGTPAKAVKWRETYGLNEDQVYNYQNFDEIINNPNIDVVFIVLPNSMHHEFTLRAAKAGKHVFCEKPMANTAQECREMIAACSAAKKQLGIGYRCQFELHHVEAMRLAREKVLGKVMHVDAGFGFKIGSPTQWRLNAKLAGGGALMDVGIYALQACRYLIGEEPSEISAFETKTDKVKFAEVDETIQWMMKFSSGQTANCTTTYNFSGLNYFTATATDGSFGMSPAYTYSKLKGWTTNPKHPLDFEDTDHFAVEMDAFSKSILSNTPFEPSGVDGLRDLLVIEAIYRSVKSGKTEQVAKA